MDKDKLQLILNRIDVIETELTALKQAVRELSLQPNETQTANSIAKPERVKKASRITKEYLAARAWAKKTLNLSLP